VRCRRSQGTGDEQRAEARALRSPRREAPKEASVGHTKTDGTPPASLDLQDGRSTFD